MPVPLSIIRDARACVVCAEALPFEPRPLLAGSLKSRLLIIGQAPGIAAHESGTPWNDPSGERLRTWLGLSTEQFYNPNLVALMPMGFCYPGKGRTGDAPPRPECAPLWHARILAKLGRIKLTIYVGRYAFEHYLKSDFTDITEAALHPERLLPERCALPHPSPLNNRWLARHRDFERQVIPRVRDSVASVMSAPG